MPCVIVVVVLVVLCLFVYWWYQFMQLLLMADDGFPGRHDKIIWGAVFICVPVLAPFLFQSWKTGYASMLQEERKPPAGKPTP
jgi:hypothetical protein